MQMTERHPAPARFRRWCALSIVGAALERRVWYTIPGRSPKYANQYIMLVGRSGAGKSVAYDASHLLRDTPREPGSSDKIFHIAPDNITKAGLMDYLAIARREMPVPGGRANCHPLFVAAEEFGNLMEGGYSSAFNSLLTTIWNCPNAFSEGRRSSKQEPIVFPVINMLVGAQPKFLASNIPEDAWDQGFMGRVILVYAERGPATDLWPQGLGQDPTLDDGLVRQKRTTILRELSYLSTLYGEATWANNSNYIINELHKADIPEHHPRLETYFTRRITEHLCKLSMICGIARTSHPVIEPQDVERAFRYLVDAESFMPQVFFEMVGTDGAIYDELYQFVVETWQIRHAAAPAKDVVHFISRRTAPDKVQRVLDIALATGDLTRAPSQDAYMPGPSRRKRTSSSRHSSPNVIKLPDPPIRDEDDRLNRRRDN